MNKQRLISALDWRARQIAQRLYVQPGRFAAWGPGSLIDLPARIWGREHIEIGSGVYIAAGAVIGAHTALNGNTYSPRINIGNRTRIGQSVMLSCTKEISIGAGVLLSDRVFIGDSYHDYRDVTLPAVDQPFSDPRPVKIEDGAFLGVGCVILPGVSIGQNGYVAANAVVTKDVPAFTIVAGNPARPVRQWDGSAWTSAGAGSL
jgi:acetyltransferase-like isoleucine patch superfamily enzyme